MIFFDIDGTLLDYEAAERNGIIDFFKYIFTSSELGISKPDPEIFHRTVLQSNLEMKDCYYIGDRLETDAISSIAAGCKGYG